MDTIVNFDYLKQQLFYYAELFDIEKKKEPLDFNELIYLHRSIKNHQELLIVKLNEETPSESGEPRGDIFTNDEKDTFSELMAFDKEIIEQIESEFGEVW